jgi:uncharacterized protein (DUF362 family)
LENTLVIISSMNRATQNLPELCSMAGFNINKCGLALIKPNVCGLYYPSLKILSAIIHLLYDFTDEILVGEAESMVHSPEKQFQKLGITQLVKQFSGHVKTVNLSNDIIAKVKVPKPHVLKELRLPVSVTRSDILVNVPKVGIHESIQFTCALKNLFGVLPEKRKYDAYHVLGINSVIADVAQIVKPSLIIVDAEEKVIIGVDPLSVDVVACGFLNIDSSTIKHLKMVAEDRGESLQSFRNKIQTIKV